MSKTKTSKLLLVYKQSLLDKMIGKITNEMIKDKNKIFFDPSIGSGQIVGAIEQKLIDCGNTIKDISKRVFGLEDNNYDLNIAKHKNYLQGTYMKGTLFHMPTEMKHIFKNIKKEDITSLTNPPYRGGEELHQRFFNRLCEISGNVITIQPATPYFNKNPKPRKHEAEMIDNILNHKTDAEIVSRNVFENATIENYLAITSTNTMQKNNTNKLSSITYEDGNKYDSVDMKDVNVLGIGPKTISVLREKFDNYVAKHGSLQDITYYKNKKFKNNLCGLPKLRSNIGTRVFYSFIPYDEKISKYYTRSINEKHDFGIEVKSNQQIKNVYAYLKTYVARFGLALIKINHNNTGAFKKVPLVDFNKTWTDEMLIKELKLTKKEVYIMKKVLGNYHG